MPRLHSKSLAALFILLTLAVQNLHAEDLAPTPSTNYRLDTIHVRETIENRATGRSLLPGTAIPHLLRGNGNLTELLEVLPDVQLDRRFSDSLTGGEILPPEISISGGKSFQNNFTIDGISNNSLLDPIARNPNSLTDVPGHSQELFLDSALVEEIIVYDTNVPARFGNFTGGVVDVRTRAPAPQFGGRLDYRTTRDNWTKFHLTPGQRAEFDRSGGSQGQPRFEKHDAGVEFNLPLGAERGLLAAYRLLDSNIPLYNLGVAESQNRRRHNLFLKYTQTLSDAGLLEISAKATPYEAEHFIEDTRDSRFIIEGGGYTAGADYLRVLGEWELNLRGAYRFSENSREAPAVWRNWAATDTKDWGRLVGSGFSREGGFGDIEKTQESFNLGFDLSSYPRPLAWGVHEVSLGLEFERVRGTYERTETAQVLTQARTTPDVICADDLLGCVDGEQFFTQRDTYARASAAAIIHQGALYGEDRLTLGRLGLRPGLRLSYDDFMGNLNAAPRFAGAFDLLGNDATVLTFGLNRYYAGVPVTYKLREAIAPPLRENRFIQTDFQPAAWAPAPLQMSHVARFSNLDTPYADEAAVGLDQALFGGRFSVKYVHREGRDEFAKSYGDLQPDGLRYYTLSNAGRSRHRSLRTTWERNWTKHFLSLNATWRDSQTSNETYDDLLREEILEERVWYRDQIVYRGQLPSDASDDPWEARLTYIARLPAGFTFTNFTSYVSRFKRLENTFVERPVPFGERRVDLVTGEEILESLDVYDRVAHPSTWRFDWKLRWERGLWKSQVLAVNLEINNVFNEKIEADPVRRTYALGRQFWAGLDYRF
ncbi:TonB-dependent receptor plug domain-containing protein [Geoalkalibacter sp.]|uniref:TonB-dependent receptor plug domain-containing protein n=1 Tax=Geoalkalibacter sp. TaxID=3041440 RepID=UPI00272EA9BD|nr:hypothetical protein [Geoalkalibacter sp.]